MLNSTEHEGGWSGGAMVLGEFPVLGRPTNCDKSRARTYCACSRCGWGCLDIFLSSIVSLFFLPLWGTARYRLKYCFKGPLTETPILRIGDQVLTFDVFWPKHLQEVRSTVYIHVQSM